jgi:hypothetical protein
MHAFINFERCVFVKTKMILSFFYYLNREICLQVRPLINQFGIIKYPHAVKLGAYIAPPVVAYNGRHPQLQRIPVSFIAKLDDGLLFGDFFVKTESFYGPVILEVDIGNYHGAVGCMGMAGSLARAGGTEKYKTDWTELGQSSYSGVLGSSSLTVRG